MRDEGNKSEKALYDQISRFRAAFHDHKAVIEEAYEESERRLSVAMRNEYGKDWPE